MMKNELDEIRSRCDMATVGDWEVVGSKSVKRKDPIGQHTGDHGYITSSCYRFDDAEFIAHARQDIPALLDYIDELHRGMDRLMEAMKE